MKSKKKKLGVNDPCPCGSGLKYKKCHIGIYDKWGRPIRPKGIENIAQQYTSPIFTSINLNDLTYNGIYVGRGFISTVFKDKRARAVGSRVYLRPLDETFHVFILKHLHEIILLKWGASWFKKQVSFPEDKIHPLFSWFQELDKKLGQNRKKTLILGLDQIFLSGASKCAILLAYDLYTLEHHSVTIPDILWERLKNCDQFQGARYEMAIAAITCRVGFKIKFIASKEKHGEFEGTHEVIQSKVIFEAKSHGRKGILGKEGKLDFSKKRLNIIRHVNAALQQTEKEKLPLIVFDDLNLPISIVKEEKERFFNRIKNVLDKNQGIARLLQNTHLCSLYITNFSWHYNDELPNSDHEVFNCFIGSNKINPGIFGLINNACKQYGYIPAIEEEFEKINVDKNNE